MSERGPLNDAMSDPVAAALLWLSIGPIAGIIAYGAMVELVRASWRWL